MPNSSSSKIKPAVGHRIGAVSALSGVPVTTLRVWEVRYGAFNPRLTEGRQRVYSDDDVLRATQLKHLTEQGHAISRIANHTADVLNALVQQQDASQRRVRSKNLERRALHVTVVGQALAARLTSGKFKEAFTTNALQVTDIHADIDAALSSTLAVEPDFLVVHAKTLHPLVHAQMQRLVRGFTGRNVMPQVIVLYHFGQEQVAESMKLSGMVVRREPISDYELADLFRASLFMDAPQAMEQTGVGATIPPRKYNDATLARMASISTNVLCECPRHVAEIIAQLVSFEQYSQECLNKSTEDARLHAYLHSVSGSARALFEHALQMVAEHEGLSLESTQ